MHVLPRGFHRIRHYGLLASGNRAANIARARTARRAVLPKRTRDAKCSARPIPRAAASMPVLRRPHDRHRDLRARLPAEASTEDNSARDQDRYIMTLSPPNDDRPDTHYSCRLATGSAQARIGSLDSPAVPPPILSPNVQPARSPQRAHPCLAVNRSPQPLRSNLLKPDHVAKSP